MPLIALLWLWMSAAWAGGSVVWLTDPPDPDLAPDLTRVPREVVAPDDGWTEADARALDRLASELEALQPLVHEFDGELEIMGRLEAAIDDVEVVRTQEDRNLLYRALAFQGFAVHRYFQDTLATDPAAAPYRTDIGGTVEVRPWVDAVAVDPDREPDAAILQEEPELRAFDETRARLLLAPKATLVVDALPHDAALHVDGVPAPALLRVRVVPGRHRLTLMTDEGIRARADVRVASGSELLFEVPPTERDLVVLAVQLREGPERFVLDNRIAAALARLPPTVHVAVPTGSGSLLYRIDENIAVRATSEGAPAAADVPERLLPPLAVDLRLGLAWLYDPAFYSENASAGADRTYATVNAGAPLVGISLGSTVGDLHAGGGLDVLAPTGPWHVLPVGQRQMRLRAHPHVYGGIEPLQATLGLLLPWHVAVGLRGGVPLTSTTRLEASWIQGLGIALPRGGEQPDFLARPAHSLTVGLKTRAFP